MSQLKDIIIFPTDTVYGMGAALYDDKSLAKIYQLKKRPRSKAILILCSSLQQVHKLAIFNEISLKLAFSLWPGPLTLILKSKNDHFLKTGDITLGIRIPNHPLALKLLEKYGPLKTTSVNQANQPPMNNYNNICKIYRKHVAFIYSNNYPMSQLSSTVVDATSPTLKIIREGVIDYVTLQEALKS